MTYCHPGFYEEQVQYIITYPLHHTQEIIARDEESVTFRIKVKITCDLVREILSHGEDVEVVKPASLKRTIHKNA